MRHTKRAITSARGLLTALLILVASSAALWAQSVRTRPDAPDLAARLTQEAKVLTLGAEASAGDVIATAQGDYARLLAVLYEEGYFAPVISIRLGGREAAELTTLSSARRVRPIEVRVDLGRPFRFGQARVAPLPPKAALPEGFRPGAPARTDVIAAAASSAVDAWRQASHAQARLADQSIVARHPAAELDVDMRIAPGPALRFGTLRVPQNAEVRPARLTAIGGLPQGAPFDPGTLETVRGRLLRTGAFNAVVLREAETPNPDGTLDVFLEVETAPRRRIGLGAEVGTQSGISFEAFWLNRNTFGGAEQLRFDVDVDGIAGDTGGVDVSLSGRLSIPGYRRPDDTYEGFAALERLDEVAYLSEVFELGIRRERTLRDGALIIGAGGSVRLSETEDDLGARRFRHALLDWDAALDRRDDPLDPRSGHYAFLALRPFLGLDAASGSGLRLAGDLRAYRALGAGTVLAGRLQLGAVVGADIAEVPPEFLFFSGGGGTVRGQSYQSLGVETDQGTVGGRGYVGASIELRRDVTEAISVVGFVDYGYIAESASLEGGDDHAGIGIGLRYRTTLGPLRADIGFPVGGESEDAFGLFIGIGQAF